MGALPGNDLSACVQHVDILGITIPLPHVVLESPPPPLSLEHSKLGFYVSSGPQNGTSSLKSGGGTMDTLMTHCS